MIKAVTGNMTCLFEYVDCFFWFFFCFGVGSLVVSLHVQFSKNVY